jgi:hypothetical protein
MQDVCQEAMVAIYESLHTPAVCRAGQPETRSIWWLADCRVVRMTGGVPDPYCDVLALRKCLRSPRSRWDSFNLRRSELSALFASDEARITGTILLSTAVVACDDGGLQS